METHSMQIKFEGQAHQIDANTLINTLTHYSAVISAANQEVGRGEKSISVKVNAPERGSFMIDLSLQETVSTLFSLQSVEYIAGLVTIVGGVFAAYKWYKGKRATKEEVRQSLQNKDNVTINEVTITNITNIYNQPLVREAISKSFVTANDDANVEGITILAKDSTTHFDKEEFADLVYNDFDLEADIPEEKDLIVDATLQIIKLSFEVGATWQFLYNGFKINMIVKDDSLMQHINDGARFAKGDAIRVRMKIVQRYNSDYRGYENKSYKIIEFLEHIETKHPTLFVE